MSESAAGLFWCVVMGADQPIMFDIMFDIEHPHSALISHLHNIIVEHLQKYHRGVDTAWLELWKLQQKAVEMKPAPIVLSRIQQLGGLNRIASELVEPWKKIVEVFRDGHTEGFLDIVVQLPAKKGSPNEPPAKRARMDDGNHTNQTGATLSSSDDPNRDAPRKTEEEMKEIVEQFLMQYDAALQDYLLGSPWNKYWEAPPSADPEIALFINDLKIPRISRKGGPKLLLHELGNGIVDQSLVDVLFNGRSRFLTNVSGSGKTRLLFEGLIRHWGFYFTTFPDPVNIDDTLGSIDIMDSINNHIISCDGFQNKPEELKDSAQDKAFRRNHQIVERGMCMVFMARVLIFEHFLKIIRETQSTHSIHEFRTHWLFLQLRSPDILGSDIFAGLMEILADANNAYLKIGRRKLGYKLREIQKEFNLDDEVTCVFDDAQRASGILNDAFRSSSDEEVKYPILRPIVSTWTNSTELPMILSGTSRSIDVVNNRPGSAVAKHPPFTLVTETGSFDKRELQQDYIRRYMPKDLLESEAGQEFLEQAWIWIRGRHQFTALLLGQLLQSSFRSPQTILDSYIEKFCGFRPSEIWFTADKEEGEFERADI